MLTVPFQLNHNNQRPNQTNHITIVNKPAQRNSRTVVNGYVDIENVPNIPGNEYVNYIANCRSQLFKREFGLTTDKRNRIENVINEHFSNTCCNVHILQKFKMNNNITSVYIHEAREILQKWNGVTNRLKRDVSTFEKYYNSAKKTFDAKKKSIKHTFWIPILNAIKDFIVIVSMSYFTENINEYLSVSTSNITILREQYQKYLLHKALLILMESTISYKLTRPLALISCCIIRNNKHVAGWINKNLDLNINRMIQNENNVKSYGAQTLKLNVNTKLRVLINQHKKTFEENKKKFISNISSLSYDEWTLNAAYLPPEFPYDDHYQQMSQNITTEQTIVPPLSAHSSTYHVSDERFHPYSRRGYFTL